MTRANERLKVLAAGVLSIVLTLGVARFAYTPLLPLMQQQAGLGVNEAGWLASINYVGYLCGALIASSIGDPAMKDRLFRLGVIVAVVTTAMMGATENFWIWAISRFFAGLSASAGMLFGTGLILNWLIRNDYRGELGIAFSGLGLGVVGAAAAVMAMNVAGLGWSAQWWVFTAIALALSVPSLAWMPRSDRSPVTRSGQPMPDNPPGRLFLIVFMAAYFCAGVGYVVTATFIVAIVDHLPGFAGSGTLVFLAIGLGATPASALWDVVARRIGELPAMTVAGALQIIGILLPLLAHNLVVSLIGALVFGATVVGLVSLVLTMAGRFYPTGPAKMMGRMTLSYGAAQVIAPALTGAAAASFGGYDAGVYLAAAATALGTALLAGLWAAERSSTKKGLPIVP
ncbi:MAG: YbfB/YjiJ family MFS transporter [Bradyrhizobium sp.]|nr:MAG: YbfB/YjiJ family MFS transporter [Bradyrhizobium sp.]